MKKALQKAYLALILIFLYAPILTLMVLSFNASKSRAKWGGFTLRWYQEMFDSSTIMDALYNSLSIALFPAIIATLHVFGSIRDDSLHILVELVHLRWIHRFVVHTYDGYVAGE